jgi:hypothetical protein
MLLVSFSTDVTAPSSSFHSMILIYVRIEKLMKVIVRDELHNYQPSFSKLNSFKKVTEHLLLRVL